jgi:hypothetical protein
MGHRQNMTPQQRLKWDCDNYKKRLEAKRGSNYEYWNEKHESMIGNGWQLFNFRNIDQCFETYTMYEFEAKEIVSELREKNNYARIVCGYDKNKLRIKVYSIIYKAK